MVEAAAPATGGSQTRVDNIRQYQQIDDYRKHKLIKAVELGLSVGRAGKVFKMSTASANLVMRNYKQEKRAKTDPSNNEQTPEQTNEKDYLEKVKLDCMLEVI